MSILCDDVVDDDDEDVLTLLLIIAHFPEKSCLCSQNKRKQNAYRWQKTNKYEVGRTALSYQSVRETVRTSCGIPSRITIDQTTPGTYRSHYRMSTRKKGTEKKNHEEAAKRKNQRGETKCVRVALASISGNLGAISGQLGVITIENVAFFQEKKLRGYRRSSRRRSPPFSFTLRLFLF